MKIIGIIPARYASTRFPGKPLCLIDGKSMIMRVYERALAATKLSSVIVATDDQRILDHVEENGGRAVMTFQDHASGTDRCNEVLGSIDESVDAVINIQGDEPCIAPQQIDQLCEIIEKPSVGLATLVKKIQKTEDLLNPNVVKVVIGSNAQALYFSRSPIPFLKNIPAHEWNDQHDYFHHIGIYAYKVEELREITSMTTSILEQAESLEQLRWLENGKRIETGITSFDSPSVDVPEDVQKVEMWMKSH